MRYGLEVCVGIALKYGGLSVLPSGLVVNRGLAIIPVPVLVFSDNNFIFYLILLSTSASSNLHVFSIVELLDLHSGIT